MSMRTAPTGGALFYFVFMVDDPDDAYIGLDELANKSSQVVIPKGTQFGFMSRFQGSASMFDKVTYRKFTLDLSGETHYDRVKLEYDDEQKYNLTNIFGDTSWIEEQTIELKG